MENSGSSRSYADPRWVYPADAQNATASDTERVRSEYYPPQEEPLDMTLRALATPENIPLGPYSPISSPENIPLGPYSPISAAENIPLGPHSPMSNAENIPLRPYSPVSSFNNFPGMQETTWRTEYSISNPRGVDGRASLSYSTQYCTKNVKMPIPMRATTSFYGQHPAASASTVTESMAMTLPSMLNYPNTYTTPAMAEPVFAPSMPGAPPVFAPSMPGAPPVFAPTMPGAPPVFAPSMPGAPPLFAPSMPGAPPVFAPTMPGVPPVYAPSMPGAPPVFAPGMADLRIPSSSGQNQPTGAYNQWNTYHYSLPPTTRYEDEFMSNRQTETAATIPGRSTVHGSMHEYHMPYPGHNTWPTRNEFDFETCPHTEFRPTSTATRRNYPTENTNLSSFQMRDSAPIPEYFSHLLDPIYIPPPTLDESLPINPRIFRPTVLEPTFRQYASINDYFDMRNPNSTIVRPYTASNANCPSDNPNFGEEQTPAEAGPSSICKFKLEPPIAGPSTAVYPALPADGMRRRQKQVDKPKFIGHSYGDAIIFVVKAKAYLILTNTPPNMRVPLIQSMMEGDHIQWFKNLNITNETADQVFRRILDEFYEPITNVGIANTFYGECQRRNELSSSFVERKMKLYDMLANKPTDENSLLIIRNQMRPKNQRWTMNPRIQNVNDLMIAAENHDNHLLRNRRNRLNKSAATAAKSKKMPQMVLVAAEEIPGPSDVVQNAEVVPEQAKIKEEPNPVNIPDAEQIPEDEVHISEEVLLGFEGVVLLAFADEVLVETAEEVRLEPIQEMYMEETAEELLLETVEEVRFEPAQEMHMEETAEEVRLEPAEEFHLKTAEEFYLETAEEMRMHSAEEMYMETAEDVRLEPADELHPGSAEEEQPESEEEEQPESEEEEQPESEEEEQPESAEAMHLENAEVVLLESDEEEPLESVEEVLLESAVTVEHPQPESYCEVCCTTHPKGKTFILNKIFKPTLKKYK